MSPAPRGLRSLVEHLARDLPVMVNRLVPPTRGFGEPDPELPTINLVVDEPREGAAQVVVGGAEDEPQTGGPREAGGRDGRCPRRSVGAAQRSRLTTRLVGAAER